MSAHTPGPWVDDGDAVSAYGDPENSETYIAPICFMNDEWKPEIKAANATLIVTSPRLLAALEALVKTLAFHDEEGLIEHAVEMVEARAAIAQARGTS